MSATAKVLLVTPDYHCGVVEAAGKWPHLGFLYVAGELRKAGYQVRIYDAMAKGVGLTDIGGAIRDFEPDVVASSAYTSTLYAAVEVLSEAKRWAAQSSRDVLTLLGGVHSTFMWEDTLCDHGEAVDIIVRHEGEVTAVEL
ncbi:MAG: magnesium-protoporphyrin IX monomethyl ester oxidative cyclase, partial [Actinobacteria bacterium]